MGSDDFQNEEMGIVDVLLQSGLDKLPQISFHIDRGLKTGDWSKLNEALKRHPWIIQQARNIINQKEYLRAQNPFMPYPDQQEIDEYLSGDGPVLGLVDDESNKLRILWDFLCRPTIITGAPGGGKSTEAKYILWQALIRKQRFNVLIWDLKREYRHLNLVTPSLKVIPKDLFVINPLEVSSWRSPLEHLQHFADEFISENYLLTTSRNLLIELCHEEYKARGVYGGSKNFPTLKDIYDRVTRMLNKKSRSFRYNDLLLWIQNRLQPYILHPCFNARRGIPFEIFQKENLVIEMDAGFTDSMFNFVVSTVVSQLYDYNKTHNLTGAKLRHLINVDEARVIFQPHRNLSDYGESIINVLVSKTRDLGIGFLVASQETASLSQTLLSLASTKITFPLTDGQDLENIQKSYGLDDDQIAYMFKMKPFGEAIVSYSGFDRPLLIKTPWFRLKKKLDDDLLAERMKGFWAELKQLLIVEQKEKAAEEVQPVMPVQASAMLYHLSRRPFSKETDLAGPNGFGPKKAVDSSLAWLEKHNLITRESYNVSGTKPTNFVFLTAEASGHLGKDVNAGQGKGGNEHRLYQHLVAEYLKANGWTVKIEGRLSGSTKAIDVMATDGERAVAFEITLNFQNLVLNVLHDLRVGFGEVVIVVRNQAEMDKAMAMIVHSGHFSPEDLEKISYRKISQFRA